jgi:capsular polysaccharide export protein
MAAALAARDHDHHEAPAHWGDMRQHIFYGALYHGCVMALNHGYRQFLPHRALTVGQEFQLYLRRLLLMPVAALERRWATRRILRGGFPFHLVLLQLAHDASFKNHSPFKDMESFLRLVIAGFATGAPAHHHLVLKAHPLEDGRVPLRRIIRHLARAHGVQARVHYVRGGKLAGLLNIARTAITVNSTAAQQALWRGLPLKAFGAAVYAKPEFVSDQPLPAFFAAATRPDATAYRAFRSYLLETSQLPGGFYSARGRHQVLRQVVDRMLSEMDPYEALTGGVTAPSGPLRLVT